LFIEHLRKNNLRILCGAGAQEKRQLPWITLAGVMARSGKNECFLNGITEVIKYHFNSLL
jgi:hypothetical protein